MAFSSDSGQPASPTGRRLGNAPFAHAEIRMHTVTRALLSWYADNARDLPWRRQVTPYSCWVAEIMLQQTRVTTVLPYYQRFMARFPTVGALASASEEEVLYSWAGLGYYRRARLLHRAAEMAQRQGFPKDLQGLRGLPGVGAYTAAAIASIAYGQDVAAVDGNLRRVVARLLALPGDPARGEGARTVAEALASMLPSGRAGEFNQALMDLGATICSPRRPSCGSCPLQGHCAAKEQGLQQVLPLRSAKRAPRPVRVVTLLCPRRGRLLLVRRPPQGLLGGLWGPPDSPLQEGELASDGARRLLAALGLQHVRLRPLGSFEHVFTHLRWQAEVLEAATQGGPRSDEGSWRFVSPARLRQLPLSRLAEKALAFFPTEST